MEGGDGTQNGIKDAEGKRAGWGSAGNRLGLRGSQGSASGDSKDGGGKQLQGPEGLLESAKRVLGRGRGQLGSASPDKRSLEESVDELEETIRGLVRARARLLSEQDGGERYKDILGEFGGLIQQCDEITDELRRMAYNAPSPWQMPFSASSSRKTRKAGKEMLASEEGGVGRPVQSLRHGGATAPAEQGGGGGGGSPPSAPPASPPSTPLVERPGSSEGQLVRPGGGGGSAAGSWGGGSSAWEVDKVIERSEVAVKGGRRLMGLLDPNQAQRAQMEDTLEELANVLSEMNEQHKGNPRVEVAKTAAETTEEQLRQLLYSLPSLPPQLPTFSLPSLITKPRRPSRQASNRQGTALLKRSSILEDRRSPSPPHAQKDRVKIPRNLGRIKSLGVLMDTLERIMEQTALGGKLAGSDAAIAANQLKRLRRQARGEPQATAVEEMMIALGQAALADSGSLEARHVALTLNGLADSKGGLNGGKELEVGRLIPHKWRSGYDYSTSPSHDFDAGEFVVIERSDGSMRFASVDRLASESGGSGREYLVRVSKGLGDAALFRTERAASMGKLLVPWAKRLVLKRELCLQLGRLYVEDRSLLQRSSARDLAAAMWAHAKVCAVNEALFLKAGNHVRKAGLLGEASTQDMATLLWAHADLGWPNKRLFQAVGKQLIDGGLVERCNQQDVSLLLWSHAKMKVWQAELCEALAARVACVGLSNSQAASNSLWAMAELGVTGCDGSVQVVCDLVRDGRVGMVTAQGAANMLWALAVLGRQDPTACDALLSSLLPRSHLLDASDKCQLHQFFLARRLLWREAEDGADDPALEELRAECAGAFIETSSRYQRPSAMQGVVRDLAEQLEEGRVLCEHVLPGIGYSVDLFFPESNLAVEVDGPAHFLASPGAKAGGPGAARRTGATELKASLLRAWGVRLVSVTFDEYDRAMLLGADERLEWMRGKLEAAV